MVHFPANNEFGRKTGATSKIIELTTQESQELHGCREKRIILLRAREMRQLAEALGVSIVCVNKWSQRFEREGLEGLRDKRGRGRRGTIPLETVEQVITQVGQARQGRRRWSTRTIGVSAASVQRIWRRHALKPHLRQTFKLSNGSSKAGTYRFVPRSTGESADLVLESVPSVGARKSDSVTTSASTITLFAALNYLEGRSSV